MIHGARPSLVQTFRDKIAADRALYLSQANTIVIDFIEHTRIIMNFSPAFAVELGRMLQAFKGAFHEEGVDEMDVMNWINSNFRTISTVSNDPLKLKDNLMFLAQNGGEAQIEEIRSRLNEIV